MEVSPGSGSYAVAEDGTLQHGAPVVECGEEGFVICFFGHRLPVSATASGGVLRILDGEGGRSYRPGGDPAVFMASGLIPGFTEALLMMPVGSHYRVVIPSDQAYGPGGSGPIGPNETLIFEIELLEIVDGG